MTGQPEVKAVLFDFHETLISADQWMAMETRGIALEIIQRLGVWSGPPPAEARHTVDGLHATLRAISREAGVEYPATEIAHLVLRALGLDGQFGDAGIAEALEALSRRGYRMGIVSNVTYAPFLAWALDAHGLRGHFERIVTSADVGLRKPRQEIFMAALSTMGLAPGAPMRWLTGSPCCRT